MAPRLLFACGLLLTCSQVASCAYLERREAEVLAARLRDARSPRERRAEIAASAAALLGCPAELLKIRMEDEDYLVEGCGRLLQYECAAPGRCCPYVEPSNLGVCKHRPSERPREATADEKAVVYKALEPMVRDIDDCHRITANSRRGKIIFSFIVEHEGRVHGTSLSRTSLGDPEVEQCLAEVMSRLVFPKLSRRWRILLPYIFIQPEFGECAEGPAIYTDEDVTRAGLMDTCE